MIWNSLTRTSYYLNSIPQSLLSNLECWYFSWNPAEMLPLMLKVPYLTITPNHGLEKCLVSPQTCAFKVEALTYILYCVWVWCKRFWASLKMNTISALYQITCCWVKDCCHLFVDEKQSRSGDSAWKAEDRAALSSDPWLHFFLDPQSFPVL